MRYIHVVSATKEPENRGSSTSPFEELVSDPNDGTTFGETQRTMFLPVVEQTEPAHNTTTQRLEKVRTGDVEGAYVSANGTWEISYDVIDLELEEVRSNHLQQLSLDYSTALSGGYTIGEFNFPFDEEFFRLLQTRAAWMKSAVEDAEIQPDAEMTFSDTNGKEVSRTATQLRGDVHNYGKAYFLIQEKEVAARGQINDATTPAEVVAVTWAF